MSSGQRKLRKRIRRKLMGAKIEIRIYDDGTARLRVDHPSNDPGTETAIAGILMQSLALVGYPVKPGPLVWRDDP